MEKKGDHQPQKRRRTRLLKEYDFFDENRSGPSNYYVVPALTAPLNEIIFPEIFNSPATPSQLRRHQTSPSSSAAATAAQRKRNATEVDDQEKNPNSHREGEEEEARALILLPPQIDHPRAVEQIIQDHQPILLIDKKLELSDVKQSQNRLLITGRDRERLMAALTEEERERVVREGEKSVYMEVITTDPRGAEYRMRLTKWHGMGAIVLNHEWFELVSVNGLEKGDSVQGWGYRAANQFRLDLKIVQK